MKIKIIKFKAIYLLSALFFSYMPDTFSQADAGEDKVICSSGGSVTIGGGTEISGACYYWSPQTGLDNPNILHPVASPSITTSYTLTVVGSDFSFKSIDAMTVYVVDFKVTIINNNTVCDGESVPIRLDLIPSSTPRNVLSLLSSINLTSQTASSSMGNPAGTTSLTFSPLNANYESTITNAIWYSTQSNHCNETSAYNISATAIVNGNTVSSISTTTLTVSTTMGAGACLDGGASLINDFSGNFNVSSISTGSGVFEAIIAMGTFTRDVQANSSWTAPANSQYHDMVRDEEQFHEGQIEGTTSAILSDLWDNNLIINNIQANGPYISSTVNGAESLVRQAVTIAITNERTRSNNLAFSFSGRRCAVETEAKNAANSSFRAAMPCTYSMCP